MKLNRTTKNYGGGGGTTIFESDLFYVVLWKMAKGIKTTIECRLSAHRDEALSFDGEQIFDSDEKCMEQYTVNEILKIIEYQKEISFEEGKEYKINEIQNKILSKMFGHITNR